MIPESINLVPRRLIAERQNRKKVIIGGISVVLIGIIVTLAYMSLAATVQAEEEKLVTLQGRATQLQSAILTYQVFQQDETDLRTQETLVANTKSGETLWSEVLDHISLIIPDNVQLDSFHGEAGVAEATFRINGIAPNFEGIASLFIRLRSSELFADVLLNGTTLGEEDGSVGFDFSGSVLGIDEQLQAEGG